MNGKRGDEICQAYIGGHKSRNRYPGHCVGAFQVSTFASDLEKLSAWFDPKEFETSREIDVGSVKICRADRNVPQPHPGSGIG